MFSSRSFIVSCLIFRYFNHLSLFLYMVRECSNFILLHVAVQLSQDHLLKRLSFTHCIQSASNNIHLFHSVTYHRKIWMNFLANTICSRLLCQIIIDHKPMGLFLDTILFHWSMCLFLCQYHAVLIILDLQYCLKSERVMPPALFFFFRIALAILCLYMFPYKF